jgi:hypothetical protein
MFPFTPFLLPRHPITQQPATGRSVGMWDFELARSLFGKQIGLGLCEECHFRLEDGIYLRLSAGKAAAA